MESIPFIAWCLEHLNYWVITLLMAIESSFIPFPSEVVVPPAAYKAATTGELNIFLVVLFSTIGACIGAAVNYYLALYLGRPLIYRFAESRFGHMCLLDGAKVENAERYFDKHGAVGTFFGRLVPAVRQLISIPAGLARMNIARFFLYTTLGAGIWNCILAAMGWYIGRNYSGQLEEKVAEYSGELKIVMLILGAAVVLYLAYKGLKK
ncbi:MAG: DedA family protein [Bacteroidaceae bacterium]|nr:DedA family protein [Bacteroidaceae bacterium]MBO7167688.1 DedA family protein [Bacteroidaceae bacterium]